MLDKLVGDVYNIYRQKSGYNPQNVVVDPATAIMFAKILIEVIQCLKKRKTSPENVCHSAKKPRFLERFLLRGVIKRQMGRKRFKAEGDVVLTSILQKGQEASKEEVQFYYDESEGWAG